MKRLIYISLNNVIATFRNSMWKCLYSTSVQWTVRQFYFFVILRRKLDMYCTK